MKRLFSALTVIAIGVSIASAQQATARLVSMASAADTARDQAIAKLESFLSKYPESELRPNALFQLGELLVRKADEEFAEAQRAAGRDTAESRDTPIRPNYEQAIARYEELVRRYPSFSKVDAAAYTLGTQYFSSQRYGDAARMFELVSRDTTSRFRAEAYFRLGDSYFELAAQQRGAARRQTFARAAEAYENATQAGSPTGDIYFLALYKLGWAYYNQATATNQEEYRKAVDVFGRLVASYDQLTPEQQARLGLQAEAIEYMAIAFTQIGGAEAADRYFTTTEAAAARYRLPVMRRVAQSLRDQGDFAQAVDAYRAVLSQSPADSAALGIQREIIDIYQNRVLDPERAQEARLQLVENFGPSSDWARANAGLVDEANRAREEALRQSAQFRLSQAQQRNNRDRYAEAAQLYARYMQEFAQADSAARVALLYGEALFGQGNYAEAGVQYAKAAYEYPQRDTTLAQRAGQNAIVAFDSALVRNKNDRAAQDAMFSAVDRYVAAFPENELAKRALIQKGKRASEAQRWDVMAQTFQTYAQRYPNDPYTPTAQKLIGDALYRAGQYAEAQTQWQTALTVANTAGRRALADSITRIRAGAAATFADTLVKQGEYRGAAADRGRASRRGRRGVARAHSR